MEKIELQLDKIINGECLEVLKTLPDEFIDCCVTSPPYYGLRDYGNDKQVGLESTPDEYVERLVAIFHEIKRCMKKDGTLWLNLGDSYNGNKKGNTETRKNKKVVSDTFEKKLWSGAKQKDLIGIPWMVAFALRADGWYLRQDIIWHKPNPMPESVTDRCTKSHEYIFLLTKSPKYYFNHTAIQEEATGYDGRKDTMMHGSTKYKADIMPDAKPNSMSLNGHERWKFNEEGVPMRNKRDVWSVCTKPSSEAHFAMYPEMLVRDCILAGCKEGGVVYDPFMGSGTTGMVAKKLFRHFLGTELNPDFHKIAVRRTSGFLPFE